MTIIAVDPGQSGGLAVQRDSEPFQAYAMPDTEGDILGLLRALAADPARTIAVVEHVGGYIPGRPQPGSAMFKFGRGFGFILGVLQTLGVRIELVRPQAWQKALSLGNSKDCPDKAAWKAKLKAEAQRLFPQLKPTLATADALLLLEFALRHPSRVTCRTPGTFINEKDGTCNEPQSSSASESDTERPAGQRLSYPPSGPAAATTINL